MLDLNYILKHPDEVKENAVRRKIEVDIDLILKLANERKELIRQIEENRRRHKEISSRIPQAKNKEELIEEA